MRVVNLFMWESALDRHADLPASAQTLQPALADRLFSVIADALLINPSEERGAAKQPGEEKRSRVVKQKNAPVCFPARGPLLSAAAA